MPVPAPEVRAEAIRSPEPVPSQPEPKEPVPALLSSRSQRAQTVYDLAGQGLSTHQIARQAQLLPGEVELILSLRRSQPGA